MLKKKSSSTEKKRKHSQSEERHDGHKRRSTESSLAVRDWRELRANAKFISLLMNTHTWCIPEGVLRTLL